jgi:hypothetical protein
MKASNNVREGRGRSGSPSKDKTNKIDNHALKMLYTQYRSFALLSDLGILGNYFKAFWGGK